MRPSKAAPPRRCPPVPRDTVQSPKLNSVAWLTRCLRSVAQLFDERRGSALAIAGGCELLDPQAAALEYARLRPIIDVVDAEALGVAKRPFEVIHQRPDEVAANIDALI